MRKIELQTEVFSRFKIEGIHRWALCPIEEVSYLREYHRHVFSFEAHAEVNHSDRDIEFIQLSHQIRDFITKKYYSEKHKCAFFGDMSCEMLATEIIKNFPVFSVTVDEDGESGATVTWKNRADVLKTIKHIEQ